MRKKLLFSSLMATKNLPIESSFMISVTILVKNSEETLKKTLESLKDFSEVLVFDTGSTDSTCLIAKSFSNVTLKVLPFKGFGPTHNEASAEATHDWVLSIDSDEVLSPELSKEVLSLTLEPKMVYCIPRHNYFREKKVSCCSGWDHDEVLRLYNRKTTEFSNDLVHEKIKTEGLFIKKLENPLLHTPYRSYEDFLSKMQTYSTLFANMYQGKKRSSTLKAFAHSLIAFLKSYLLKRGIFGGSTGLIISFYNAHVTWYKYLKLTEKNHGINNQKTKRKTGHLDLL
jgi:glycosyltransferase involved in cell wall biosynthesis